MLAPTVWSLSGAAVGGLLLATKWGLGGLLGGALGGGALGWVLGNALAGLSMRAAGRRALSVAPSAPSSMIDAIKKAQLKLNALGFGPLAVDGIIGPKTHAALEKFQRGKAGVMMTGLLDQATLKALGVA